MTIPEVQERIEKARAILKEAHDADPVAYAQVVATLAVAEGLARLVDILERDEGSA